MYLLVLTLELKLLTTLYDGKCLRQILYPEHHRLRDGDNLHRQDRRCHCFFVIVSTWYWHSTTLEYQDPRATSYHVLIVLDVAACGTTLCCKLDLEIPDWCSEGCKAWSAYTLKPLTFINGFIVSTKHGNHTSSLLSTKSIIAIWRWESWDAIIPRQFGYLDVVEVSIATSMDDEYLFSQPDSIISIKFNVGIEIRHLDFSTHSVPGSCANH